MKILSKNLKKGEIKVLSENQEDIWSLTHIIEKGDRVTGIGMRELENTGDKLRQKKTEKIPITVTIRVEKFEFQGINGNEVLRILGIIENAPQNHGKYQTIIANPSIRAPITIEKHKKHKWSEAHLKLLEDAVRRSRSPQIIALSLDDEEALITILTGHGPVETCTINSGKSGKDYSGSDTENQYYTEIGENLNQLVEKLKNKTNNIVPILILGPGFAKEKLLSFLRENYPELAKNSSLKSTGERGMAGINEALKKGYASNLGEGVRVEFEHQKIEKLFSEISKNGKATYGFSETKKAVEMGAAEELLVAASKIDTSDIQRLLEDAARMNCTIQFISPSHDAGRRFLGIGGIAAFLRFQI
jgi:protein pelota